MQKKKHPEYQQVLFVDSSTGFKFVCGSTLKPQQTATHEGKTYPVYPMSISSASHPLFTGSKQLVDSEGRVDKFKKRYEQKAAAVVAKPAAVVEAPAKKAAAKKTTAKKA